MIYVAPLAAEYTIYCCNIKPKGAKGELPVTHISVKGRSD
jgi:hypothetical protein